jgi:hypothetical protein
MRNSGRIKLGYYLCLLKTSKCLHGRELLSESHRNTRFQQNLRTRRVS